MPFVTNRSQRIHYTLDGDGPVVVLQHGYLSSANDWQTCGYVDVLVEAGDHLSCFYLHGRDAAARMADFFRATT